MKFISFSILLFSILFTMSCTQENPKNEENISSNLPNNNSESTNEQPFAIVLHGGAGSMTKGNIPDSIEAAYYAKLDEAITAGYTILENGGTSIEAVQATINVLEDSPLFNAGKGAVLNNLEKVELDASVMEGKNMNVGAVAGVKHIKNPINLAISVLNNSKHVLLAGEGAENFAVEQGFELVPEEYFIIPERIDDLRKAKGEKATKLTVNYDYNIKGEKMGTVGCVALDKEGNITAGTSTGGLTNKKFGRVGDSPIIGAGTYANNKTCGVSCTGVGEYYIRGVVAYDVSALMEYKGLSLEEATHKIMHEKQKELGGSGGIIALDKDGNISMDFNTNGMFRAKIDKNGKKEIGIYAKTEKE